MAENREYMHVCEDGHLDAAPRGPFMVPQYEIVQYFSGVQSKRDIVEGFLDFAGRCFSTVSIFSARSTSIQFLKGRGENIRKIPQMGSIHLEQDSVMRRVSLNKYPYRGPIPSGKYESDFFGRFFNRYADEIFIYPGSIRSEDTDALFYADGANGERALCLATFEYVVEKTILALRLLWVQKQLTTI